MRSEDKSKKKTWEQYKRILKRPLAKWLTAQKTIETKP